MAYIDMELVKGPELRSIIEAFNGSGLLAEPIDLKKGRRINNLAEDFVNSIESVNGMGRLDEVPEAVFNYYVAIVKEGDPPDKAAKKQAAEDAKAAKAVKKMEEAKAKAEAAAEDEIALEAAKEAAEADAKAAAEAEEAAKAKAASKAEAKAKAEAVKKKQDEIRQKAAAAADKKTPAKKDPAKKAAAKKPPAKPKKPTLVKAAVFGKVLLGKKAKKWDIVELVQATAEKTKSPYVDTRRKCNTYIALLRTMGVLEDAGDKLVLSEWYRKALADK
jgi:hypothetical protein